MECDTPDHSPQWIEIPEKRLRRTVERGDLGADMGIQFVPPVCQHLGSEIFEAL